MAGLGGEGDTARLVVGGRGGAMGFFGGDAVFVGVGGVDFNLGYAQHEFVEGEGVAQDEAKVAVGVVGGYVELAAGGVGDADGFVGGSLLELELGCHCGYWWGWRGFGVVGAGLEMEGTSGRDGDGEMGNTVLCEVCISMLVVGVSRYWSIDRLDVYLNSWIGCA